MPKTKIELPSILTESSWFYKDNEELCKPHLGKHYLSYSSASSWNDYRSDFIKQKFAGIKLPSSVYALFGSYVGTAIENGKFPEENPCGFTGQENLDFGKLRPEGAEYEKMILIDRGDYIIIGFIDVFQSIDNEGITVDIKTGGKGKEKTYENDDYIQVVLYSYAIEQTGGKIKETGVHFIRRKGSHINPPLHISEEQFYIPLEYSKERVEFALKKMDKAAKEISDCYSTYTKIFKD